MPQINHHATTRALVRARRGTLTPPVARSETGHSDFRRARRRVGSTVIYLIATVTVFATILGIVVYFLQGDETDVNEIPLLSAVSRGTYEHEVLEQGEVESSNNVEIRCEIRRGTSVTSTSIIDLVREGTLVKKGDWLITFDSSALEQERGSQRIAVNTIEALVIQAKATFDTATIAKKEYLEGTYREQEKTIQNQIFVAQETLKKAQLSHDSIKRLVSRGLLTSLQLQGEQFRVDAAQNDLDLSNRKLEVLEKFTQQKMLTQLQSDIESAQVKWKNEQSSHEEELKKLREIEDQIAKCRVVAPQDGQVVFANITSSRSGSEFVVEAGAMVRENQVVLRLPDPNSMQVKAKVSESRINLLRDGMPVSIRIDAFGEEVLDGTVTRVNKYAEPGNWWSSTTKEYATLIKIFDPPPTLRVGLTAEVRIHVESREDALQVPVQAIYERHGKTFCLVQNEDHWDTREIIISSTNEKTAAVDEQKSEPLREGDMIVLNPRKHLSLFDPSRLPKDPIDQPRGAISKSEPGKSSAVKSEPGKSESGKAELGKTESGKTPIAKEDLPGKTPVANDDLPGKSTKSPNNKPASAE